jgi:predicted transcriptional regulator of viral defense system
MPKNRDAANKLFEIAEGQQGYFTYKQALAAGYYRRATHFYSKTREWLREKRGIYRLAKFPLADRPDLVIWSLWSSDRKGNIQGVYSHQTALSLYDITDVNPAKIHMTVPRSFRKGTSLPKILALHRAEIPQSDISRFQGYRVTSPARTIRDMLEAGTMQPQDIKAGLRQAVQKGLITRDEADKIVFPKDI